MESRNFILAATLTIASSVVPVGAEVLRYEIRGTVDTLYDGVGLLGSAERGDAFTLTYFADFSAGAYIGAAGGFGASNGLIGGTEFASDPFYPSIQKSPVSALLEVNGHELAFLGTSYGQVQYTQNWASEPYVGHGYSWADLGARVSGLSGIASSLHSDYSTATFGSIKTLGSVPVDGRSIYGSTSFSYDWGTGTDEEFIVSGSLTATGFSVAAVAPAVPEPENLDVAGGGAGRTGRPAADAQPRADGRLKAMTDRPVSM